MMSGSAARWRRTLYWARDIIHQPKAILPINFAITGLAGYIAPRHLQAIKDAGGTLVAGVDPHDSVGILDSYFPNAAYFTEFERFDRYLEMLRRSRAENAVHYLSICSPNHLHDAHIRVALRTGSSAICEKPLVVNPWNLDALEELEQEAAGRVYTVLQLRLHPQLVALKERLSKEPSRRRNVRLSYVTSRGTWYRYSWKGDVEKSGGVATNIGIHFFDLLVWLFGDVERNEVHVSSPERLGGTLQLKNADVQWFLSVDPADLPQRLIGKQTTYRSITVDGEEIEFSGGFRDLHSEIYRETLAGRGFGIDAARPSIELVYQIRTAKVVAPGADAHPLVRGNSE